MIGGTEEGEDAWGEEAVLEDAIEKFAAQVLGDVVETGRTGRQRGGRGRGWVGGRGGRGGEKRRIEKDKSHLRGYIGNMTS